MEQKRFDVIVVGAGAAGLVAALEIALTGRAVAVLEAKERCGGRMNTVYTKEAYPIELGAEFVHGNLPVTLGLLKKAGIKTTAIRGRFWQSKNGELKEQDEQLRDEDDTEKKLNDVKEDMPVAQFLSDYLAGDEYAEKRSSLKNYVQSYYAGDVAKVSTFALRDELTKEEEEQYRIKGGYQGLVDYLENRCREKGVEFFFSEPVHQINWQEGNVTVFTGHSNYEASKLAVTVSIGVLAACGMVFKPALPEKAAAAKRLGFGHVVKIILAFDEPFWRTKDVANGNDLRDMNFLFSEEAIPTWWTQHPEPEAVLVGWLGGPKATAFQQANKDEVEEKAISSLSRIFNIDVIHLSQKLVASYFHGWQSDPAFCGAYSYEVVNGQAAQQIILQPAANTVYFAGEGLHHGPQIGTVEAALQSGQTVARNLIAGH